MGHLFKKCCVDENGLIGIEVLGGLVEIRMGPKVTTLSRLFPVDSAPLRKEKDERGHHLSAVGKADVKAGTMAGTTAGTKAV
jgi:hypothetical protein